MERDPRSDLQRMKDRATNRKSLMTRRGTGAPPLIVRARTNTAGPPVAVRKLRHRSAGADSDRIINSRSLSSSNDGRDPQRPSSPAALIRGCDSGSNLSMAHPAHTKKPTTAVKFTGVSEASTTRHPSPMPHTSGRPLPRPRRLSEPDVLSTISPRSGSHKMPAPPPARTIPPLLLQADGFLIEVGIEGKDSLDSASLSLIDQDRYTAYFAHYFQGKDNFTFVSVDENGGPVIVFVEKKDQQALEQEAEMSIPTHLRVLVHTAQRPTRDKSSVLWSILSVPSKKANSVSSVRKALLLELPELLPCGKLMEVCDPAFLVAFGKVEARLYSSTFKWGVLYAAPGQSKELDMLGNRETSADFVEFLAFLGDPVRLEGFEGFRGGLDVRTNTTGEQSVHTEWKGYEIMYHVAPYLPYTVDDPQQLAKKRHLGNDVVVLIFKEGTQWVDPSSFRSHFNHIFVVVSKSSVDSSGQPLAGDAPTHYAVQIARKVDVHNVEPALPFPSVFPANMRFRNFLFTKCMYVCACACVCVCARIQDLLWREMVCSSHAPCVLVLLTHSYLSSTQLVCYLIIVVNLERAAMKADGFANSLCRTHNELFLDLFSVYALLCPLSLSLNSLF